ncbi:MAG TPA: hypothetical protein VFA30_10115 [Gaiellaceae bacterium]|nr:hypothetical protein [Gaiellaceae bacterium]
MIRLAVAAALVAVHPLPALRTPSGNISCFVAHATLHCKLARADYAPAMTKRCGPPIGLDWAGFALGVRGPARVECTGGVLYNPATERPAYRTLSYGRSRRLGGFTCDSERIGLTCRRTSHGLFISRETWRLW